jgi:hypothetical protein
MMLAAPILGPSGWQEAKASNFDVEVSDANEGARFLLSSLSLPPSIAPHSHFMPNRAPAADKSNIG